MNFQKNIFLLGDRYNKQQVDYKILSRFLLSVVGEVKYFNNYAIILKSKVEKYKNVFMIYNF